MDDSLAVGPSNTALAMASNSDAAIRHILRTAREYLGLQVAFISEFANGERVFRYVDAAEGLSIVSVGGSDPVEESYCHFVVRGDLPQFLRDPMQHPISASMPAIPAIGVGTHLSVPIQLSTGEVFGTFCCFGLSVDDEMDPRAIEVVRLFAQLTADYIDVLTVGERDLRHRREQIESILHDADSVVMLFQPLIELQDGRLIGVESLARFADADPEEMFNEAWAVGLGVELELKAVVAALDALPYLDDRIGLGVNVSPATLIDDRFLCVVEAVPPGRLTVEVTEHAAVNDYDALRVARDRLDARGISLAIDDVGKGFSGIHHIIECGPKTIKIDAAVVRDVHTSTAKLAMIEALVAFGRRLDVLVVAEGIETVDELRVLHEVGVPVGQGYFLGRPMPLDRLRRLSRPACRVPLIGSVAHRLPRGRKSTRTS